MHNRDMIWVTADGRQLKLRDITSKHLVNISYHLDKNLNAFIQKFGKAKIENCKYNIKQEIRLRKLNRIKSDINEGELF